MDIFAFYGSLVDKLSFKINNVDTVVNFGDMATAITRVKEHVAEIEVKLSSISPDIALVDKTSLADFISKTCVSINTKMADGVLEPMEIINLCMEILTGDVKPVMMHVILSIIVLLAASLLVSDVISVNTMKAIVRNVCMQLDTYKMTTQLMGKMKCGCCF